MKGYISIIFWFALLIACEKEQSNNHAVIPRGSYPDQESWNATVQITNEGRTVGRIIAGHVEKYSAKKETHMSDSIEVHFYNQNGIHTSVLYSLGGIVYEKKQNMMAFGNVVVVSDSGIQLFTDTLNWDNNRQKVYTECPVTIITDHGDTLYGDSFISDSDLINYEIIRPRGKSSKRLLINDE